MYFYSQIKYYVQTLVKFKCQYLHLQRKYHRPGISVFAYMPLIHKNFFYHKDIHAFTIVVRTRRMIKVPSAHLLIPEIKVKTPLIIHLIIACQ